MPIQTYEDWYATKQRVTVKGSPFEDEWDLQENEVEEIMVFNWNGTGTGCDGYIERHKYYRFDKNKNPEDAFTPFSTYYLILERDEYISFNLEELAKRLYDWIVGEGFLNTPEENREQNVEIDVHNISLEMGAYLAKKYNPESGDEDPGNSIALESALKDYLRSWMELNNIARARYDGPDRDEYARQWMTKQREAQK